MKHIRLFLVLILISGCALAQNQFIPKPQSVVHTGGDFPIPETLLISNNLPKSESEYFSERLQGICKTEFIKPMRAQLVGSKSLNSENPEAYELHITHKKIFVYYNSDTGYFRALQTLAQLFEEHKTHKQIPNLKITDEPKFKWRGMHLDVVRHFFTVNEVKQYLDILAFYKINRFHWHLTDDQGWRIEIKQYPLLTEVGSKRKESMIGPYGNDEYDGVPYGGFYTQEEIKEVVEYAKKLHITVVPEIEMPGHSLAALSAYPELACTDGPFEAATKWGVFDDIFCPKEETFEFLENVLTEVMELFPSDYIHIGGDEAPKTRWKECAHCQELIVKENLKDEDGLQSYFIHRIEEFVNSKGRTIIGWDEILEGGLAPNAAVMSWRGEEGGIAAAKAGNFAVMTPGGYCYFDHYQGDPQNEPLAFGGFTPLEKVYSYSPIPEGLSEEEAKFILGPQANLWAEYILDFNQIQYMLLPRLMALSEVAWGTSNSEKYPQFEKRVVSHFELLDEKGINYSKSIFNPSGNIVKTESGIAYEITTSKNPDNIRFTVDGSVPDANSLPYSGPIPLNESMEIRAAYFEGDEIKSAITGQKFNLSKSSGKEITLVHQPSENYAFGGALTLVDGVSGDPKTLGKTWLGFSGTDVIATIRLGKENPFSSVEFQTLNNKGSWIHMAGGAKVYVSDDGKTFTQIGEISKEEIEKTKGRVKMELGNHSAEYLKVEILNAGEIPAGDPGAGHPAWLFVDEIAVF